MLFDKKYLEEERVERLEEIWELIETFLTTNEAHEVSSSRAGIMLKIFNPRGDMTWTVEGNNPTQTPTALLFEEALIKIRTDSQRLSDEDLRRFIKSQKNGGDLDRFINKLLDDYDIRQQKEDRETKGGNNEDFLFKNRFPYSSGLGLADEKVERHPGQRTVPPSTGERY